ncbi:uncharacterized protein BDR25DRAFT_294644 [Lindgomyces ingoldianus]|uniref:Uncharacterized protein n=1 Tax=Lindgomyces ingoldianus TaxID=673940 RepID=A0ACB6QI53_9PLEO|nr:uncharacterized protein BDR25DRAFT_294644 [Lindgomyces ingoldianus]KAF2466002.1 hypothetical protein BDR25DRAFT_294644 [Lindgomyces ingoldianus]
MHSRFLAKKRTILEQLDTPDEEYHDLSPKGSIDQPIRSLISNINRLEGLVTTSSCSGRVSVFLEGKKKGADPLEAPREDETRPAGPGGKGGGSWLFVSHSPVQVKKTENQNQLMAMFGLRNPSNENERAPSIDCSFIHLKFEPMILHILAASMVDSHRVLTAAIGAGFRESGAMSLGSSKSGERNPMVAVRSTGYSFDSIIGYQNDLGDSIAMVDEVYLRTLVDIANDRFSVNSQRIDRFRSSLLRQFNQREAVDVTVLSTLPKTVKADWEQSEARRQRKRAEGLNRQQALHAQELAEPVANLLVAREDVEVHNLFDH